MRQTQFLLLLLVLTLLALPRAWAVQPDEILSDSRLEARARSLSKELRCMVCQNQSIDDSDAPLARDLRILVRERLQAGDTDQEVKGFLIARYGEFVLLRPVFSLRTALLWLTPFGVIVFGAVGAALAFRSRSKAEESLSPGEQARLAEILQQSEQ